MYQCKECKSKKVLSIKTYKRIWHLCEECGSGYPIQRKFYPLQFLPNKAFKKNITNAEQMYDYFIQEEHLIYSKKEAENFINKYVNTGLILLQDKKILDVSGGNGVFLSELVKHGASGTLTEINEHAINFAKTKLNLDTIKYDLNKKGNELPKTKFDYIFLRACLMFCENLEEFLTDLRKLLNKDGKIFVQYAVYPTIGTLIRTHIDEFSYFRLRSPKAMREIFLNAGFKEEYFEDEIDPTLYVYDHDYLNSWLFLHYMYEIPAIVKLRKSKKDNFRLRSRNRANFIFGS